MMHACCSAISGGAGGGGAGIMMDGSGGVGSRVADSSGAGGGADGDGGRLAGGGGLFVVVLSSHCMGVEIGRLGDEVGAFFLHLILVGEGYAQRLVTAVLKAADDVTQGAVGQPLLHEEDKVDVVRHHGFGYHLQLSAFAGAMDLDADDAL